MILRHTHSVLPLFASQPGCATYVPSDAWKLFLHHSGSAGVTCGTAPSLPDVPGQRQEPSTQVSCLACEAWQVLHSLWQQRELEANLQLCNWVSKHGWACSGNNALQLPRDEWLCQTSWLWQAPPPAASVPGLMPCLNLEDDSRPVALTALHTWQGMCLLLLLHCAGVEVGGVVLAPNVASEAGSREFTILPHGVRQDSGEQPLGFDSHCKILVTLWCFCFFQKKGPTTFTHLSKAPWGQSRWGSEECHTLLWAGSPLPVPWNLKKPNEALPPFLHILFEMTFYAWPGLDKGDFIVKQSP